ncbi:N,N'-diacetyllegionaminic acid synthase [Fundidesulfovibrio magnetotacticus]|uniref:N,N'-diacetyllegionaminic acid synthase n=1 Tax=Fundidesulfovibrio magnetotacticus TaxID=2730080 RepID=A0A6V8LSY3_9BACT|nr:N-acetylneuraminate synthase family protein [Fundidesulfovibrio magnetotacticus]GFK94844.1 N,N'-diacetyllegionaminic acid synthase [Fundidesulfovibrio magnetotacticus]
MNWFERHIVRRKGCFVIAEAGINHNGAFDLALELVRRAKEAGADCVKFQTHRTSASESRHSSKPGYFSGRIGEMSKIEWSRSLEFSTGQFAMLRDECEEQGIAFLSTACDIEGLRILTDIRAEAVKIASADLNNDYLLSALADTGLPVLLSVGMSTLEQVDHAVELLAQRNSGPLALFQCTSQYPAPYAQLHLRVMETLKARYGVPVGFSDHSQGIHVPVAAAALGAAMVEKHFTLSRNLPGVDHAASIEPHELAEMVRQIRDVEAALGSAEKTVQPEELANAANMRRSLMAARPLKAGALLTLDDVTAKRPGTGLPPSELHRLLGRRLKVDMAEEDLFDLSQVDDA